MASLSRHLKSLQIYHTKQTRSHGWSLYVHVLIRKRTWLISSFKLIYFSSSIHVFHWIGSCERKRKIHQTKCHTDHPSDFKPCTSPLLQHDINSMQSFLLLSELGLLGRTCTFAGLSGSVRTTIIAIHNTIHITHSTAVVRLIIGVYTVMVTACAIYNSPRSDILQDRRRWDEQHRMTRMAGAAVWTERNLRVLHLKFLWASRLRG